jgi:hypothetical protein
MGRDLLERFQIGHNRLRVGAVHAEVRHGWAGAPSVSRYALHQELNSLFFAVSAQAGDCRRPQGPLVLCKRRCRYRYWSAKQVGARLQVSIGISRRVALAAHGDLIDNVLASLGCADDRLRLVLGRRGERREYHKKKGPALEKKRSFFHATAISNEHADARAKRTFTSWLCSFAQNGISGAHSGFSRCSGLMLRSDIPGALLRKTIR